MKETLKEIVAGFLKLFLWMGSVRSWVLLLMTLATCYMVMYSVEISALWGTWYVLVLNWYFKDKKREYPESPRGR